MSKMKWLSVLAVLIIAVLVVLLVQANNRNNLYERHISWNLRNDQSEMISTIYMLRDDAEALLGGKATDPNVEERMSDNLYMVARIAQDMDGMAVEFGLVSRDTLANTTSSAAVRATAIIDRIAADGMQANEREELQFCADMLKEWTKIIERTYPGYQAGDQERAAEALNSRIGDPDHFVRNNAWQELIVGLESVSKVYNNRLL